MAELITGRIYSIRSPNTEMVYIGSTIQKLHRRFKKHITEWKSLKKKYTSYLILEKGEAYIELLEEVEVESKRHLRMIEQKWLDTTPNTVNEVRAFLSREDQLEYWKKYKKQNKERYDEYFRNYSEEHKEKISEKYKKRWEITKDEINKKRRETYLCEVCDCFISKGGKKQHERTKKHIANLEKSQK
jgi:hypothetical protein